MLELLIEGPPLGELMGLKPMSYPFRLFMACLAFGAAMNAEKVVLRAIGLALLLITGGGLLLTGFGKGTIVDILLGFAALGAAGYAWWSTRS